MMSGLTGTPCAVLQRMQDAGDGEERKALQLSRFCIEGGPRAASVNLHGSSRSWSRASIERQAPPSNALTPLPFRMPRSAVCAALANAFLLPGLVAGQVPDVDRRDLVIAATTDVHGRVRGWDYFTGRPDSTRGLSRAATIVDSLRVAHPGAVVLVDAGDMLEGNPLTFVASTSNAADIHPVIAAMNAMRYDAAAVGNHEFNYGMARLRRVATQAMFPFLAANARLPNGSPAFAASHIVTRAGVRVGIVGATNPGAMIWDRDKLRGKLLVTDIVPAVALQVAKLKRAGVDVVLVLLHSGLDEPSAFDTAARKTPGENVSARVALEVPGIDVIVFGHSHRELADSTVGQTLLVQPRNWAASVAAVQLSLERRAGRWTVASRRGQVIPTAGRAEQAGVLAATERGHAKAVAYVGRVIGSTRVTWSADSARVMDTPLTDFLLEVERRTAGADLAASPAYDLDARIPAGPVTVAQIARLYPYENTLRAVRITGRQLRAYLEYSARYFHTWGTTEALEAPVDPSIPGYNFDILAGADYVIDVSRPIGDRVTRLEFHGRPVNNDDTFTMALNNYRQTGGGGYAMLQDASVVYDKTEDIRQLLIDEVRRRGMMRPEDFFTRNWHLEPPAAVGAAYRAITRPRQDSRPRSSPFPRSHPRVR